MSVKKNKAQKGVVDNELQLRTLKAFTSDMISCLYQEECLSGRKEGLVLSRLHPQTASKLAKAVPDADAALSVRNHLAFAPYTYVQLEGMGGVEADIGLWFSAAIDRQFAGLSEFLMMAVPQLRADFTNRY